MIHILKQYLISLSIKMFLLSLSLSDWSSVWWVCWC